MFRELRVINVTSGNGSVKGNTICLTRRETKRVSKIEYIVKLV